MAQGEAHLPHSAQRSLCHWGACGCCRSPLREGSWDICQQHALTSSAPRQQKPSAPESGERSAGQRSGPGLQSPKPGAVSLEVGQPPAAPRPPPERLPGEQRRMPGARGTRQRRQWPGRCLPRCRGARARARPGPRPPGRGSVGGVRRERAPRRMPPSRARGLWAREGCHPLTGGSDPSPSRRARQEQQLKRLSGSRPTSRPAKALRCTHPPRPCLTRSGPRTPATLRLRAHSFPKRHHPRALEHRSRKRVPWHGTGPQPQSVPERDMAKPGRWLCSADDSTPRGPDLRRARTPDWESVARPGRARRVSGRRRRDHRALAPADPGSAHPRWR